MSDTPRALKPRGSVRKPKPAQRLRKPVRRVSSQRAKELARYAKLRVEFLATHSLCQCWTCLHPSFPMYPATQVHHMAGRMGKLLCHSEFWLAVCNRCYRWIHNNPSIARAAGLIAPVGQWNKQPTQ